MSSALQLQSAWLDQAIERAEKIDDWLSPQRQEALSLLKDASWPGRKTEAWKYTSLYSLQDAEFETKPAAEMTLPAAGQDSIALTFSNGCISEIPSALPEGLSITTFSALNDEQKAWVSERFSSIKPQKHLFGLVNDTLAVDGVVIDVADEAEIRQLVHITQQVSDNAEAHARILVRVGRNAKFRIAEQFGTKATSFQTLFAEYALGEQAALEHYRFCLSTSQAMNIGGCHFELQSKADLNSTLVGFGSLVSRTDVDVIHAGEHTNAKINAVYLLDGEEQYDLHSTIEHAMPHGMTEENVRGIVADREIGRAHV